MVLGGRAVDSDGNRIHVLPDTGDTPLGTDVPVSGSKICTVNLLRGTISPSLLMP